MSTEPEPVEFKTFNKIPRLRSGVIVTEKIDGTNAQIVVPADPAAPLLFGSRNRWITPGKSTDNYGFAAWATENEAMLRRLGPGRHYGEWWGAGIARKYGLSEKRWSLFNVSLWTEDECRSRGLPDNVHPVPVLYRGPLVVAESRVFAPYYAIDELEKGGSVAAPGFMQPEGVVLFINGAMNKFTFGGDGKTAPSPEEG